jgi:hypothetical protein
MFKRKKMKSDFLMSKKKILNIPKNYVFFFKVLLFQKNKIENYNICIDNIINVKNAKVLW